MKKKKATIILTIPETKDVKKLGKGIIKSPIYVGRGIKKVAGFSLEKVSSALLYIAVKIGGKELDKDAQEEKDERLSIIKSIKDIDNTSNNIINTSINNTKKKEDTKSSE